MTVYHQIKALTQTDTEMPIELKCSILEKIKKKVLTQNAVEMSIDIKYNSILDVLYK